MHIQVLGEELDRFGNMMKDFAIFFSKNERELVKDDYLPKVGEYCAAKFTMDGKWYRSRVLKTNYKTKSCQISYIDYGNTEITSFSRLVPLHLTFS